MYLLMQSHFYQMTPWIFILSPLISNSPPKIPHSLLYFPLLISSYLDLCCGTMVMVLRFDLWRRLGSFRSKIIYFPIELRRCWDLIWSARIIFFNLFVYSLRLVLSIKTLLLCLVFEHLGNSEICSEILIFKYDFKKLDNFNF